MTSLAALLAVMAFLLAWPVPRLLHQAKFRTRSPWAAMLLWQAIALSGGLSIVGAPLVFGLSPFGDSLPRAVHEVIRLLISGDFAALADLSVLPVHIFSLCLAVVIGIHLLLTLLLTYLRVLGSRRRHRDLVRLLSRPVNDSDDLDLGRHSGLSTRIGDAHLIEHQAPLAYCLPGRTAAGSVTVLSRGLLDQLSRQELAAVIAHEKTHLRQRHHLLTMAFDAWYRALPWLPTTRYGREAVLELTEMLADDGALRHHSREDLLRSLALSSPEPISAGSDSDAGPGSALASAAGHDGALITTARLQRLLLPPPPLGAGAQGAVIGGAVALLLIPTALLVVS